MTVLLVLFGLGFAVITALPVEDQVITKLDGGGPRFQYMVGPKGPELVDLWVKTSDLREAARFNPDINNNYHLFTRSNPSTSRPIPFGDVNSLRSSNYNANRKTVVLIHGWHNTPTSDFNVHLTNAYLTAENVNLLMVDWSFGAGVDYPSAIINVGRSADHVARYINWLISASGGNIARFHIIGHSLGAHQAGMVGRHLNGRVPYLTGLDPAMPGWITSPNAISSNVAQYTEIMHTDAGLQGLLNPAGHVDFYPNGGRGMPGCGDSHCDHHRCIFYMAESLTRGGFTGRRCNSLSSALSGNCNLSPNLRMGGPNAKPGNSGIYFLTTNAGSPFSQG